MFKNILKKTLIFSIILSMSLPGRVLAAPSSIDSAKDPDGNMEQSSIEDKVLDVDEEDAANVGRLLVVFNDEADLNDVDQAVLDVELDIGDAYTAEEYKGLGETIATVEIPEDSTYEEAANQFANLDSVAYVQPDFLYELQDEESEAVNDTAADGASLNSTLADNTSVNDPSMSQEWYLKAINAEKAWNISKTEGDVTVVVMDTGCCLDHEDLKDNIDLENAYQVVDTAAYDFDNDGITLHFIAQKEGPLTESFGIKGDLNGHGTSVAGIISGVADNSKGIAGVSYNATILPINVFNVATEGDTTTKRYYSFTSNIISAYDYLIKQIKSGSLTNVRVINLSLGGYHYTEEDKILNERINQMNDEYNIVTVCAAGNNGASNSSDHYDSSKKASNKISPGDDDKAVSVTAIREQNYDTDPARLGISDFNEYKDIAAPGEDIYTTQAYEEDYGYNKYAAKEGTSFAAPCVSGVLALMFAYDDTLSADEAKQIIYDTARDITSNANDSHDSEAYCDVGWDKYTGYGLIDAYAALKKLSEAEDRDENEDEDTDDIKDGGIYTIKSAIDTGKSLDIYGGYTTAKANLQLYSSNGTNAQKFIINKNDDDTYSIYAYCSGMAFDVYGGGLTNGTNVWQFTPNDTVAQNWYIEKNSDGTYSFKSALSGLYLDVAGASAKNGTNVQTYTSNGTAAQKFVLECVDTVKIQRGWYYLANHSDNDYVLDVSGAGTASGTNIWLYKKNNSEAQQFKLTYGSDGSYVLKTFCGKAVDVYGGRSTLLTNVWQYNLNYSNAQKWNILENSDGSYTLLALCSGLALDIRGGKIAITTNVDTYRPNQTDAQKWDFISVG